MFCLLIVGSFVNLGPTTFASSNIPSQVTVTLQTPVYKQAKLTSEVYTNQDTIIYLSVGTTLNVDTSFTDGMFYKVDIYNIISNAVDGDFGYVLKSQTLDSTVKSPAKKLVANAKVKNDNSKIYTYDYAEDKYNPVTDIVLNKGTDVRILDGYDKNKTYTFISFVNQDNEIVSYYIETTNLEVSGVSYTVIVAIIILISCAGIVGAIFGVKLKKSKKKATK